MYDTQAELEAFFKCLFQFRPLRKLGEGAFGMAILVFDEVEEIHKVFKLPRDQRTTDALLEEGSNLRKLSELLHPNIIRLYQYGKVRMEWGGVLQDRYYLNMAYGGTSLRDRLGPLRRQRRPDGRDVIRGGGQRLTPPETVRIALDVCLGLEAAHGFRGAPFRMLHRDVSPDNILIDEAGTARLTDFGIARIIDRSSAVASFAGKLLYMDPECYRGRASATSDLYSLGIVLYEMVTGELPFGTFEERLEAPPRPPHELVPEVPPKLSALILRTLDARVECRYASASQLLAELRRLQARLTPLPSRYARVGELADGRLLCEDREAGERVAVRLVACDVPLAELTRECNELEKLNLPGVEVPLRLFRNEELLGVVSPVPVGPDLAEQFGKRPPADADELGELCQALAQVSSVVGGLHRASRSHGLLSPFTVSLPGGRPRVHECGCSALAQDARAGPENAGPEGLGPAVNWLSPQRRAGSAPNPRDDVWTLGTILESMLSGASACPVPPRLAAIVRRAVANEPGERFESATELADALNTCRWPDDVVDALLEEAVQAYPEGGSDADLIRACGLIDRALAVAPGNPKAHQTRGLIYFRNGSDSFAIHELKKAARVAPNREVWLLLGQSYARHRQQHAEAVAAYRAALEFGEEPALLDHLARSLKAMGNLPEAVERMRRAAELAAEESDGRDRSGGA